MNTPTATELLYVWEQGLAWPLPRRMLALLAAALPEANLNELAELPIGQRDAHLLHLRERLFGPDFTAVAQCPSCSEQVESTFRVDDIRLVDKLIPEGPHSAEVNGYNASFRLPTTHDLLALTDANTAHDMLLARCIIEVRNANGETVAIEQLPDEVVTAISAQMAAVDPQADIELSLTCPACEHRWPAVFDIASFLYKELNTWALRTLRDVHGLARSYGWREADILALSPTRRQFYLELSRQ
jgi:uncharacterized protein (UPF0212 family)